MPRATRTKSTRRASRSIEEVPPTPKRSSGRKTSRVSTDKVQEEIAKRPGRRTARKVERHKQADDKMVYLAISPGYARTLLALLQRNRHDVPALKAIEEEIVGR